MIGIWLLWRKRARRRSSVILCLGVRVGPDLMLEVPEWKWRMRKARVCSVISSLEVKVKKRQRCVGLSRLVCRRQLGVVGQIVGKGPLGPRALLRNL